MTPLSARASEEQFELFQLDYLAGDIELDFTDRQVMGRIEGSGRDPSQWFSALYKLQLLGVGAWPGELLKKSLRRDGFQGHVKKPLKGKLPLSVQTLWMSDGQSQAALDDLSDGEVQLLLTLGAVRLFGDNETLFLYDEPETHLYQAGGRAFTWTSSGPTRHMDLHRPWCHRTPRFWFRLCRARRFFTSRRSIG